MASDAKRWPSDDEKQRMRSEDYKKRREVALSTGQWPGEVAVDGCDTCPFSSDDLNGCAVEIYLSRQFTQPELDADEPPGWSPLRVGRVAVALSANGNDHG